MRRETELWLQQAQADFATARQLLGDGIYYASVFFAHQSAEKALKALWIHQKAELAPWTHNLVSLVRELGGGEALIDDAAELPLSIFSLVIPLRKWLCPRSYIPGVAQKYIFRPRSVSWDGSGRRLTRQGRHRCC